MSKSRRRVLKTISLDEETLEIIRKLRERNYNVSSLIRGLLKEFYEHEVEKK